MIFESIHWKKQLLRIASHLCRMTIQKSWKESTFVNFEQDIFIAFYSIRKLIEARRLTNSLVTKEMNIVGYPAIKTVTMLNSHRIAEIYNLRKPKACRLNLIKLTNQFMHSYIFMLEFNKSNKLSNVLISSDYAKNTVLYKISVKALISIVTDIGNDCPNSTQMIFNKKKKDYDVYNTMCKNPNKILSR
jgi:hypothetical protein